ncbi:MAG: branched-chain amino acid ABC transporter permease [Synergistetes bacterium]|nr:branched-chain amino acid ABC transporter permease [Synergistota bacterium]MDW8192826.1 branched-chain amino acid ABC transporter permease [Synergistota bacterium]
MGIIDLFQQLANGLSLGSLYALVAIGYTMVYGIIRLINFAHGDIMMIGCYLAYFGVLMFHLPWQISWILAVSLTSLLGVSIYLGAYKPLRRAPRISALITAIGVSFLLESLGLVIFGGRPRAFPRPAILDIGINVGGVYMISFTLLIPLMTGLLLLGLIYLVYRTKIGMAMRAVATDIETTSLMGVDVDKVISFTFAVGSALAAAGGIMWAIKFPQINPYMGIMPGLKAFIAAVFGGIGNIFGAMLGGFLLGMIEILIVAFMPSIAGYRDAIAFSILVAVLLFKPTGLLGETLREKV